MAVCYEVTFLRIPASDATFRGKDSRWIERTIYNPGVFCTQCFAARRGRQLNLRGSLINRCQPLQNLPGNCFWQKRPGRRHDAVCPRQQQAAVVQIERAVGCLSFSFGIFVCVKGIVPQGVPHSGGMRTDLVARATPDAAPDQRQPNTVKLGIFCEGELRQVVPFKVMERRKICPARAAGIAIKHAAFAALVRAQGKSHGKIFFQPPGQKRNITLFAAPSRLGQPKSLAACGESAAHTMPEVP